MKFLFFQNQLVLKVGLQLFKVGFCAFFFIRQKFVPWPPSSRFHTTETYKKLGLALAGWGFMVYIKGELGSFADSTYYKNVKRTQFVD